MSDNIILNNEISVVEKNINYLLSKINKKKWNSINSFHCNGYKKKIYSKTIDLSGFPDFGINKIKITEIYIKENYIKLYIIGNLDNFINSRFMIVSF